MADTRKIPDWETLLAHAARLQTKIPGAVLVGGTAAALHAKHRYSVDHDHVIRNLEKNYDEILTKLAAPDPYDLTDVDLAEYKGIIPPWHDWHAVESQCRSLAEAILCA